MKGQKIVELYVFVREQLGGHGAPETALLHTVGGGFSYIIEAKHCVKESGLWLRSYGCVADIVVFNMSCII